MSPTRRRARIAFVAYALALFVMTHWPRLRIEGLPMERPDLVVHFVAFGLWTALLAGCAWFGAWRGARNIALSVLIGAAYASADEALQLIPALDRSPAWSDLFANLAGVACVGAGVALSGVGARRADMHEHRG